MDQGTQDILTGLFPDGVLVHAPIGQRIVTFVHNPHHLVQLAAGFHLLAASAEITGSIARGQRGEDPGQTPSYEREGR